MKNTRSAGAGLERSCRDADDRISSVGPVDGVELCRAWFAGAAYASHRHDTYAVGVTECGVQVFGYRGATRTAIPGDVVALYPDEVHDGRAGTAIGFGYRIAYVEPSRLAEAVRVIGGRGSTLPFLSDVVSRHRALARAIARAFESPLTALAADALIVELAEGLIAASSAPQPVRARRVDVRAVERARAFLEAEKTRAVRSTELEAMTGLTRYDLARQFRIALGTSPHRYLVMRRLDFARERIRSGGTLAGVACEAGFADQPHFTRAFKAAFGVTPARYRAWTTAGAPAATRRRRRC